MKLTNRDFNEDRALEIEQEINRMPIFDCEEDKAAELIRTVMVREPFWSNTEVARYVVWQLIKDAEAEYVS